MSSGNILLVKDEQGYWRGLLIDWELSKDLTDEQLARQPDHTVELLQICIGPSSITDFSLQGTFPYMSVLLLLNATKGSIVQDDLESFFHVMLYNAVRYLKSNCSDVQLFIKYYFDDAVPIDREYRVGVFKKAVMRLGLVELPGGSDNLEFYHDKPGESHPINKIIRICLSWFKAYYKIHLPHDSHEDTHRSNPPTLSSFAAMIAKKRNGQKVTSSSTVTDTGPTAEDREQAAKLDTHDAMIDLLRDCIVWEDDWPKDGEEKRDRLRKDRNAPQTTRGDFSTTKSRKRSSCDVEALEMRNTKRSRTSKRSSLRAPIFGSASRQASVKKRTGPRLAGSRTPSQPKDDLQSSQSPTSSIASDMDGDIISSAASTYSADDTSDPFQ